MANQTGRPVAPARKLVAAVMGTIAVFVVAVGLGMSSWGVVVFGLAVLALSIALGMVNVVRRGARAWVSGTAEVKAISPPPASSAVYGRAEIQAVVVAPGLPTSEVTIREPRVPVVKWPRIGDTLPITVDVDDMRRVRINWDEATPQERGEDPPPPPATDYGDIPDDYDDDLDDDLLGDVEPPPWTTPDRQWDDGPPPPPPAAVPTAAAPTTETPVVVRDTPAGVVVEGEFVDHNSDTQPLPRRAPTSPDAFASPDAPTSPASAASPEAAEASTTSPEGSDASAASDTAVPEAPAPAGPSSAARGSSSPGRFTEADQAADDDAGPRFAAPAAPAAPAAAAAAAGAAGAAAHRFANDPYADQAAGPPRTGTSTSGERAATGGRRPSPRPRPHGGGTATATADPLTEHADDTPAPPSPRTPHPDDLRAAHPEDLHAAPAEDLHAAPAEDLHAAHPEDLHAAPAEDLHAAPAEDLRAAHPEDLHAAANPVDIPLDDPVPHATATYRRPEPTVTATTATPSPSAPPPTAPQPTTPPPTAPPTSMSRPTAPEPSAHDDIDVPLDADPTPIPEATAPGAPEALAEGLIAPPATEIPPAATAPATEIPPAATAPATEIPPAATAPATEIPPAATAPATEIPPAPTARATEIPPAATAPTTGPAADRRGVRADAPASAESRATTKFTANAAHDAESYDPTAEIPVETAGTTGAGAGPAAPTEKHHSPGVVAGAAAAVGAVAASAVAAVKRLGHSDKDPQPAAESPEVAWPATTSAATAAPSEPAAEPTAAPAEPSAEPTPPASTPPASAADKSEATPWSTPPTFATEPDEHADDLITAYPSARPGPAGAIYGVGITVLVTDLARSIAFYRDTLGFYEIDSGDGSAVLASGDTRLVLRTVSGLGAEAGRLIYLNLEVGDVEAVYAELTAKGVTFVHPPQAVNRGDRLELWSATFLDPDSHNIAITQWRAIR